ncbi:hypothetical protein BABINDRAFT_168749 [Babjeviella inositovora NRRL Y-12698]|uniref:LicD/FKTN/FKRP nucleotidyltransferase domain-containing protein n=1 Tax=Babjeviella inositovora NRRL Y-12698 TaxID=984486 RepID=A0A1E3QJI9_9ASCO|nr:uncharacterized protein BABINDRAFT_168749 [Babjeviella inositovora NRRL Y-12698]ODQ77788.1 hypothetical protein BABINDRAFT_168749 [Babjeviella inositovora NRRL Y-12698]
MSLLLILSFIGLSLRDMDLPSSFLTSKNGVNSTLDMLTKIVQAFTETIHWDVPADMLPDDINPIVMEALDAVLDDSAAKADIWKYDFSRGDKKVIIPAFYLPKSKLSNPLTQSFDPRFTWGIYLHHMAQEITQACREPTSAREKMSIPFVWSEWVDLSELDGYVSLPLGQKPTCGDVHSNAGLSKYEKLRAQKGEKGSPPGIPVEGPNLRPDRIQGYEYWMTYCDDEMEITNQLAFPGFQITGPTREKSSPRLKSLHAKSYLLGAAPAPSQIVWLVNNGSIIVDIDPNSTPLHLNHTLVQTYIRDQNENRNLTKTIKKVGNFVNVTQDIADFRSAIHGTPNTVSLSVQNHAKENSPILTYKVDIADSEFHGDCYHKYTEMIRDKLPESWTTLESNYYNSVEVSKEAKLHNLISKYFYETEIMGNTLGSHYDWRFFDGLTHLDLVEQRIVFHHMLRTWLKFTGEYGLTTWVAHGSLLSWYWNGMSFPWDNDLDVQMPLEHLHRMALQFNQSLIVGVDESYDSYLLDVGTFITERTHGNGKNNIDARLIHTGTGLYIDITGISLSGSLASPTYYGLLEAEHKRLGMPGSYANTRGSESLRLEKNTQMNAVNDRNGHYMLVHDLTPLRLTLVEGAPAYVPQNYKKALGVEYARGMVSRAFKNWAYEPLSSTWMSKFVLTKVPNVAKITGEELLEVLQGNEAALNEVYATHALTRVHRHEMSELEVDEWGTEKLVMDNKWLKPVRCDLYEFRENSAGLWGRDTATIGLVYQQ